jgi:hypothetical protein
MADAANDGKAEETAEIIPVPYFSYDDVSDAFYDFCAAVSATRSSAEFHRCARVMFNRLPRFGEDAKKEIPECKVWPIPGVRPVAGVQPQSKTGTQPNRDAQSNKPIHNEQATIPNTCAWIPVSREPVGHFLRMLSAGYGSGSSTPFYHKIWLQFCETATNPATYKPVFYALLLDGFHGYDPWRPKTRWINTCTELSSQTLFHRAFQAREQQAALRVFMDLPKEPYRFDVNACVFDGNGQRQYPSLMMLLQEQQSVEILEWFLASCSADTLNGLNMSHSPIVYVLHEIATWARHGGYDGLMFLPARAILRYAHEDGSGLQLLNPNAVARLASWDHFYDETLLSKNEFDVLKRARGDLEQPVVYTLQELTARIVHHSSKHGNGVDVHLTAFTAQLDAAIERQLTYPARLLGTLDATMNTDNNAFPLALLPLVVGYVVFPQT